MNPRDEIYMLLDQLDEDLGRATPGDHDSYVGAVGGARYVAVQLRKKLDRLLLLATDPRPPAPSP
jgi:hypothetical protein